MATLRGCHFPEDLYYLVEKHVWVKPLAGGLVRGTQRAGRERHRALAGADQSGAGAVLHGSFLIPSAVLSRKP